MSLRRSSSIKKSKKQESSSSSSSSGSFDEIKSDEPVSSDEEVSSLDSTHSVSGSYSEEEILSYDDSGSSCEDDYYYRPREPRGRSRGVRYVVVNEKRQERPRHRSHHRIIATHRPKKHHHRQSDPREARHKKKKTTKSSTQPSTKKDEKRVKKREKDDKKDEKKKDKKKEKGKKKKEKKRDEKEEKKKPVTPRGGKKKNIDTTIYEDDEPHVKLAKAIPHDIASKLGLASGTTIIDVTKRVYDRDSELFAKMVVLSNRIHTANFTVGYPSASNFTYEELYTCLMNDTKVIDLERCVDADHPKANFRRLPHSFAKRTAMLQLFNDNAPAKKKEDIAKPTCKNKVVVRMNWLLNHQPVELATPSPSDPCSEICILLDDAVTENAEDEPASDQPINIVCISQADVIRRFNLVCVKPKATDMPLVLADIESVILARLALLKLLNSFIDGQESAAKNKGKKTKKSSSSSKRKRDEKDGEVKPEKKAKKNEEVTQEPVNDQVKAASSSSTSSSEEEDQEQSNNEKNPVGLPFFMNIAKKITDDVVISSSGQSTEPSQLSLYKNEADKKRAADRAALLAQFRNTSK